MSATRTADRNDESSPNRNPVYTSAVPAPPSRYIVAACGLLACTKPAPNPQVASDLPPTSTTRAPTPSRAATPEPTPPTTAAPDPQPTPEPQPPAEPDPERADVEWVDSPLQADLDGDGVAEPIRFTCGPDLRITVGRTKTKQTYRVSELIGCSAAIVTLRPGEPTRQVVFTIDEHEEVGPDLHFLYAYAHGKLERVWSDSGEIEFLLDGRWTSATYDCDDVAGFSTITTLRHRWDGTTVTSETQQQRTPIEPGACADP